MVAKSESRRGIPITLVAIHTNEGDNPPDVFPDRTAEGLAGYLDRENAAGRYKSYHRICDDDSTVMYVPDGEAAWALPGGNLGALQLCFTGWARWSRDQWLEHPNMLARGAVIVRAWCDTYGLPRAHLTPDQVAAGHRGVIGHVDWTRSREGRGTHTDPGPSFPWDRFLAMVNYEEDDMPTPAEIWAYPIPDPYVGPDGKPRDPKPATVLLGHGAANAAYAKVEATKALGEVAGLRDEIADIKAQLPNMIAEEIRAAIADGVLDVDISVRDKTTPA